MATSPTPTAIPPTTVKPTVSAGGAGGGSGTVTARPSLLTRPLSSGDKTINASTFGYLFSQVVQLCQGRAQSIVELERRLDEMGHGIGLRFLELCLAREKPGKREIKLVNLLQYLSTSMWKTLFGKKADGVEKSKEHDNVYMIRDNEPLTNKYISVPRDYAPLNCAAFIGGIVRGILDAAGFTCTVTTHSVTNGDFEQSVFVIEFAPECLNRDV